jgi:surface antigen
MKTPRGVIMRTTKVVAATLVLALLAACESPQPSKEDIGMAAGAVLGGVIGHQFGKGSGQTVATIGGAALGAFVGSRVGRNMDRGDQARTTHALDKSSDGESTAWRNDETGTRYSVTPTRTYQGNSGGWCRDFTTVAQIDGRDEVVHGTACRQPDGTWKTL